MVREGEHGTITTLSIVPLLQEKFRQLQRMKEMRQEQELLRMLSECEKSYSPPLAIHKYDKSPKPHCQLLSLSLWPADSTPMDCPSNRSKSLFTDAPLRCALPITLPQNSASDYIDTSLRL